MHRRQRGQALPLGLALILFGILGGFVLYNTGQSAADKARLVNAADSAAYSGILWQARALNFQAYTNRAMVANQVSMAQAVSLRSWVAYGNVTSENIGTVLAPIPVVGQVAAGLSGVIRGVNQVMEPVTNAMLGVVDKINVGVGAAQQGMFLSSFAATPEIVSAVAKSSNERFSANTAYSLLGAVGNLQDWQGFTRRVGHDDADGMKARMKAIEASRDEFSKNRSHDLFGSPLYIIPFQWRVDVVKQGETRLIRSEDGRWEWKAKDTVSIHNEFNSWIKGWKGQELPLGWAQAYANNVGRSPVVGGAKGDGAKGGGAKGRAVKLSTGGSIEEGACSDPRDFVRLFGDHGCETWSEKNELAEMASDVGMLGLRGSKSRHEMRGYSGVNPFRNLSEDTIRKNFPTLRLKVEVALPLELTESTDNTVPAEPFATGMSAPGGRFSSISIAEVFFKPPHADDPDAVADERGLESANAYSPYWDVRLAPVSQTERLAAFAMRDHFGSTAPGGTSVPDGGRLAAYGETGTGAVGTGGLARYGELAGETGADLDRAAGLVADGTAPGDLATVGARFTDVDLEQLGARVKDQLVASLENAAREMLSGAAGIDSREELADWANERTGGMIGAAETARAGFETELATLRGQQAEFERIAEAVSEDVVDLVRDALDEYGAEQGELVAVLEHVDGALDAAGDPLPTPSPAEIRAARERLAELEAELVETLADELVERVDAVATTYRMPRGVAETTIEMLLRDLRRSPTDEPDWDPFGLEGKLGAAGATAGRGPVTEAA